MIPILDLVYKDCEEKEEYKKIATKVLEKCFRVEKIDSDIFYISVTLTNPENIRKINNQFRKIDKETDVLSFPMFEKEEIENIMKRKNEETQEVLGDIIISIPKVYEQAEEYGHGFEREFAYMLVHGFYHLMGYDHMEENEKKIMREKEENVLEQLEIIR